MLIQLIPLSMLTFMIFLFPLLTHPLAMGLNLLFSTFLVAMIMGVSFSSFWISYTLMLILSGGLLVIFIYVSLLASNESFKSNITPSSMFMVLSLTITLSACWFKSDQGSSEKFSNFGSSLNDWLSMLYNTELYQFTLFIIIYLLVTLLVVVFNTKKNSFPLRSAK